MKKIKIGLLGLGTVGTGVYKLIGRRADIMDKTIGAELEIKMTGGRSLRMTRYRSSSR